MGRRIEGSETRRSKKDRVNSWAAWSGLPRSSVPTVAEGPERRSEKHDLAWDRMKRLIAKYIPPASVCHHHSLVRFGIIT